MNSDSSDTDELKTLRAEIIAARSEPTDREEQQLEVVNKPFMIDSLCEELVKTVQPVARYHGNSLTLRCVVSPARCCTDREKLHRVLLNLLSNACKFTEKGAVEFAVSRESDYLDFLVTDTGCGMSGEELSRAFTVDPYLDPPVQRTRHKYAGTGLGLPLALHLTKSLGGEISAESARGRGSTFRVRIPDRAYRGLS